MQLIIVLAKAFKNSKRYCVTLLSSTSWKIVKLSDVKADTTAVIDLKNNLKRIKNLSV